MEQRRNKRIWVAKKVTSKYPMSSTPYFYLLINFIKKGNNEGTSESLGAKWVPVSIQCPQHLTSIN